MTLSVPHNMLYNRLGIQPKKRNEASEMDEEIKWLRRWEPKKPAKPKEAEEPKDVANMSRTDYHALLEEMQHR